DERRPFGPAATSWPRGRRGQPKMLGPANGRPLIFGCPRLPPCARRVGLCRHDHQCVGGYVFYVPYVVCEGHDCGVTSPVLDPSLWLVRDKTARRDADQGASCTRSKSMSARL